MTEAEVLIAEERLRSAMLRSDVVVLDELLAPELIFTNHLGRVLGKEDDLAAHRSGVLKVRELNLSEQVVLVVGDVAVVSVRTQLAGTYDGNPANGDFRFTRVWALSRERTLRVVAVHAGIAG
ncbi:MAG: nuclear transport factor 2 family protein [Acidobacteriaceae bacterium]